MSWRYAKFALLIVLWATALSAQAYAQGAIAGVVTDETGGVLPGVTVEAASPALIEKVRTVVTDAQGRYNIVDLRPGVYTVTFTLSGFATVVREGIELRANFTAPVNVVLKVGALEESLTVSGASPVVDVQSTVRQQVMTREVLDAIPQGRNIQAIAAVTPGVVISRPDVGGLEGMQLTGLTVHGSLSNDMSLQVDGMSVTSSLTTGSNFAMYHDEGAYQEISYQTSGISAEVQTGGIRINMIPKEGGNMFSGFLFAVESRESLQSDNYSDELQARGLRAPQAMKRIWDYNGNVGGPLTRDKLWFFTSVRNWGLDQLIPDSFDEKGNQGVDDNMLESYLGRLTWQASARNKITSAYNKMPKWRGHRELAAGIEPKATVVQNTPLSYIGQAKWVSTLSTKALFELGFSETYYNYWLRYQPTVKRPTATDPYGDIAKVDLLLGTRRNAALQHFNNWFGKHNIVGKYTYVTGSHALKTGVQWGGGPNKRWTWVNGDLIQRYTAGVPNSVQTFNTPVYNATRYWEMGIYVEDAWTIDRLTLTGGVRFEVFNGKVDEQTAPAGRFVPERHFAEIPNLPNWKDVTPRAGVAFDVFGNGKTAIKGSVSRYSQNEATGFPERYNPLISDSDTRTWDDLNRDDIAQENEIGPSTNRTFGIRANRNPDPNIERPYHIEYNVGVQHELSAGLSVAADYFRRGFYKIWWSDNLETTRNDYTLLAIADPRGNGQTVPVYNLNRNKLGLVNVLDTNSTENKRTYNGFEFTANGRLKRGASLLGGVTIDRTRTVTCQVDDPNSLLFCDQTALDGGIPFLAQIKLAGDYPLPGDIHVSGVWQSYPGNPLALNYVVTRQIVPTLTLSSVSVPLVEPGSKYLDRVNQLDVRVTKVFRVGTTRVEAMADLYNVTNANTVLTQIQAWGPSLGRPQSTLPGRFLRLGAQLKF